LMRCLIKGDAMSSRVLVLGTLLLGACSYYIPVQVASSTVPLEGAEWDVLGPVSATRCDPNNSLKETLAEAMQKQPGANALVGVVVDFRVVPGLFAADKCTTVTATAVKVRWRQTIAPPPEAAPPPAAPAPGGEESLTPLPGACESVVKKICECEGPPRSVVRRICAEAIHYQRTQGDKCLPLVKRIRMDLRCVGDPRR
jgi:hypothetical protein